MNEVLFVLLLFLTACLLLLYWNLKGTRYIPQNAVRVYPGNHPFSHSLFESLLQQFVDTEGKVNYLAWVNNAEAMSKLDQYVSNIALFSPDNSPHKFPDKNASLVYWVYCYNALVIKSILHHWPLHSVTDIKAPLEFVKGLGFFYKQRFIVGGKFINLYQLENKKLRFPGADPKLHFILNCGSESCPKQLKQLAIGSDLNDLLANAARDFINDTKNVFIDHQQRAIQLSRVFKWYLKDFIADVQRHSEIYAQVPFDVPILQYIYVYSAPLQQTELIKSRDYKLIYSPYNWQLNQTEF